MARVDGAVLGARAGSRGVQACHLLRVAVEPVVHQVARAHALKDALRAAEVVDCVDG